MTTLNVECDKNSSKNEFINQFFVAILKISTLANEKSNVVFRDKKQNYISMFYIITQNKVMIDNLLVNETFLKKML